MQKSLYSVFLYLAKYVEGYFFLGFVMLFLQLPHTQVHYSSVAVPLTI